MRNILAPKKEQLPHVQDQRLLMNFLSQDKKLIVLFLFAIISSIKKIVFLSYNLRTLLAEINTCAIKNLTKILNFKL